MSSRRLRKQLDALQARLDRHHPEPRKKDPPSRAVLEVYSRLIDLLAKQHGTTEWRADENGELQPVAHDAVAAKQDIKTT